MAAAAAAGSFPSVPGEADDYNASYNNCRYCDFARICSNRRDAEFEAKRDDPDVARWLRIGAAAGRTLP